MIPWWLMKFVSKKNVRAVFMSRKEGATGPLLATEMQGQADQFW
jgi:hypothetical protein